EAIAEYDKARVIYERLVNEEQQGRWATDLAKTYANKGNAFTLLTRWDEAIAEYDKAIAILERLVNEGQQAHLAPVLALFYMNKALTLEAQTDVEGASFYYGESLKARTFCVEELKMFWIMPELLETAHYQLMTLLSMQRWPAAARNIL